MWSLGPLAFASPWLLLGLLSLPVIWWLLRITPPSPQRVAFPPVRILRSLTSDEEAPDRTPLWLTILRLVLAALAVLALAQPLINPRAALPGNGPILLVVDNGWAAAGRWTARQEAMADLLARAEREQRGVVLLATARSAEGAAPAAEGAMTASAAADHARAMQPMPWPTDHDGAAAALERLDWPAGAPVYWLSDGIASDGSLRLAERLARLGDLTVLREGADAIALLPPTPGESYTVDLLRSRSDEDAVAWVRAVAGRGRVLARAPAGFAAGDARAAVELELPTEMLNEVERLEVESERSAAATVLLDERWRRRPVGLASGASPERRNQPLLSSLHYLSRALSPFTDVTVDSLDALLDQPMSLIALSETGRLTEVQQQRLQEWIEEGGVLLRFADARLAEHGDDLLPVRLRRGGRALGGALSWSQPAKLAPFSEQGPFRDLPVPDDVEIRQQVLAQPSLDLDQRTWARLADGTPLVTAESVGDGHLVLFHTTANADWSNLPLSGLYVQMLRRLVGLSRGVRNGGERRLPPYLTMDGFGQLQQPGSAAEPLDTAAMGGLAVGPAHPPGFYGREDDRRAVNLTQGWQALSPLPDLDVPHQEASYAVGTEIALKPALLTIAAILALADLIAVLALRGLLRRGLTRAAAGAVAIAILLPQPEAARAQDRDAFALAATEATRLAYVLTGDVAVDETSRAGLFGLSEVLARRTSVEAADPMGVDVETDELVLFPLIYWPVTPTQPPVSPQALSRIADFMRTGGTILFDNRDNQAMPDLARRLAGGTGSQARLRDLLRQLDLPPLTPVPQDHVLTKAFYLMQDFPGRYAGGQVWVEHRDRQVNDGVSPVIIGGNDWAAAWAIDADGQPLYAVVPGGERQREMAYRFGVNLVMYTLTGNYKADQVHVPAILERLGQ